MIGEDYSVFRFLRPAGFYGLVKVLLSAMPRVFERAFAQERLLVVIREVKDTVSLKTLLGELLRCAFQKGVTVEASPSGELRHHYPKDHCLFEVLNENSQRQT